MPVANDEEKMSGDIVADKDQDEAVSVKPQPSENPAVKNSEEKSPEEVDKLDSFEKHQNDVSEGMKEEDIVSSHSKEEEEGNGKKEADVPKKGLLDKPLVVEGKRERHSVNRLVSTPNPPVKKSSLEVSGTGVALGDIEYVNVAMSKVYSEGLKSLHKLCYGKPGTTTTRKRDLRKFNGFSFEIDSPEFERKKALAMKLNFTEVRVIRKILGSEPGQSKADAVVNILKFLQKPRNLGLKIPDSRKRKSFGKSKAVKKAKRESSKGRKKSPFAKQNDEDEGDSDDEDKGVEETRNPEKPLTTKKTPKVSKRTATIKLRKPAKKASANTASTASPSKPEIQNWGSGGPTDEELNTAINEILHSVDLVHCTMKQMCQRISEKFPSLDMVKYKSALKDRVKEALEQMEDA